MKDLDAIFDEINGHGKFQRILLYVVLGPIFAFMPLAWNSELLLLNVNDHWCYHPMTEGLNATELDLWKECYLPPANKSCEIYLPNHVTPDNEDLFWNQTTFNSCPSDSFPKSETKEQIKSTPCKKEWSYDQSEFKRTLVSDLHWVCDDAYRVPEQYTWSQMGILMGSLGLNYLADRFGRKKMLWISLAGLVIPMLAKTFLVSYYYLYTALNVITYACIIAVYQIPTSMLMEIVDESYRSWALMYTWLIW